MSEVAELDEVVLKALTRVPRFDSEKGQYVWEAKTPEVETEPESPRPQDQSFTPKEPEATEGKTLTFKDVYPAYGYHREDDPLLGFDPDSESEAKEPDFEDASSKAILDALPAEVPSYIKAVLLLLMGAHRSEGAHRGRPESD